MMVTILQLAVFLQRCKEITDEKKEKLLYRALKFSDNDGFIADKDIKVLLGKKLGQVCLNEIGHDPVYWESHIIFNKIISIISLQMSEIYPMQCWEGNRPDQDERLIELGSGQEVCEKCIVLYPRLSANSCYNCELNPETSNIIKSSSEMLINPNPLSVQEIQQIGGGNTQ